MKKKKINISSIIFYLCITLLSLVFLYPFIYTLTASLKSNSEIFSNYFGLPKNFHFENYFNAWQKGHIGKYFMNSMLVVTCYVVIGLIISSLAAFAIARIRNRYTNIILLYFTAGMMVPVTAILVPLAKMSVQLHGTNNYPFLIAVYIGGGIPYLVFVITGFMKSIPAELEEAAIIDGAGIFTIYYKVILPLSKPVLATMGILAFLSSWNDLILSLLFIKKEAMKTLSVGLLNFTGMYTTDYVGLCAAIIIANIPIIIIYLCLQEYVEKGLTSGAVKG